MELIIHTEKKPRVRNSYKVDVKFMYADGYEHRIIIVSDQEFENNKEDFLRYLCCIDDLIKLDSNGRGGIDRAEKFKKFYSRAQFLDEVVENWNDETTNKYTLYFPSDGDSDFIASVESMEIIHFDSDGDECNVTIKY